MSAPSPRIVTFGCRLNTFESEVMRGHATAAGLDSAIIFNTCAVTAEAERQARQAIRKARRENPGATLIVTGCAAQIHPQAFADMPEVDRVIGNADKLDAAAWAAAPAEKLQVTDIMALREMAGHMVEGQAVSGLEGRARAFVQVQNGCDHRCTFCIIPFGRGPSRSVPVGGVVAQVRGLVEAGYREVVLTGVDIAAYGLDLPRQPRLAELAGQILRQVPDLARLRLSSLDPVEVDDALIGLLAAEPRMMPHLHLSIQAGSDLILKRMKRRHSRAQVIDLAKRLREARPGLTLGADLIAGFPTETEEAFAETRDLVAEAGLTFLHVFPYSARSGTPAARMPQVAAPLRKERAAILRAQGEAAMQAHLAAQAGREVRVLVEQDGRGHGEDFSPVQLTTAPGNGALLRARVVAVEAGLLIGEVTG